MVKLTLSQAVAFLRESRPGIIICEHKVSEDGRILIKSKEIPDGREARARHYYTFEKSVENGELVVRCLDTQNQITDLTAEYTAFVQSEEEQCK